MDYIDVINADYPDYDSRNQAHKAADSKYPARVMLYTGAGKYIGGLVRMIRHCEPLSMITLDWCKDTTADMARVLDINIDTVDKIEYDYKGKFARYVPARNMLVIYRQTERYERTPIYCNEDGAICRDSVALMDCGL